MTHNRSNADIHASLCREGRNTFTYLHLIVVNLVNEKIGMIVFLAKK